LPEWVKLSAAYVDTERIEADSGKRGDAATEVIARILREDYRREFLAPGAYLLDSSNRLSAPIADWETIRDDREKIDEYARDRADAGSRELTQHAIRLPYADTHIHVGDVIRCNNRRLTELAVAAVTWDLRTPYTELLVTQ
jgi:hypothetical protein